MLLIDIEIDALLDEWKILKLNQEELKVNCVNSFWSTYICSKEENTELKYPKLSLFLKSSLSLYQGSIDIECGFSISKKEEILSS